MNRKLIQSITALSIVTISSLVFAEDSPVSAIIDDFTKTGVGNESVEWRVVNDGVMGGLSEGTVSFPTPGVLRFSGTLSLENNGGFSSIRRDLDGETALASAGGIKLRVKGDGRTYDLRLTSDARHRSLEVSYRASFATKKDRWIEIEIPFDKFGQSVRGLRLGQYPFVPEKAESVGFILADKKAGPFELDVDWIRALGHE